VGEATVSGATWQFVVKFRATDRREAEDYAAGLADLVEAKRWGRSALHYVDPITGDFKTWAEPARTTKELEMDREPL
jgi:hypothetical protein